MICVFDKSAGNILPRLALVVPFWWSIPLLPFFPFFSNTGLALCIPVFRPFRFQVSLKMVNFEKGKDHWNKSKFQKPIKRVRTLFTNTHFPIILWYGKYYNILLIKHYILHVFYLTYNTGVTSRTPSFRLPTRPTFVNWSLCTDPTNSVLTTYPESSDADSVAPPIIGFVYCNKFLFLFFFLLRKGKKQK